MLVVPFLLKLGGYNTLSKRCLICKYKLNAGTWIRSFLFEFQMIIVKDWFILQRSCHLLIQLFATPSKHWKSCLLGRKIFRPDGRNYLQNSKILLSSQKMTNGWNNTFFDKEFLKSGAISFPYKISSKNGSEYIFLSQLKYNSSNTRVFVMYSVVKFHKGSRKIISYFISPSWTCRIPQFAYVLCW